jgi:hypothetical protein
MSATPMPRICELPLSYRLSTLSRSVLARFSMELDRPAGIPREISFYPDTHLILRYRFQVQRP